MDDDYFIKLIGEEGLEKITEPVNRFMRDGIKLTDSQIDYLMKLGIIKYIYEKENPDSTLFTDGAPPEEIERKLAEVIPINKSKEDPE